MKKKEEFRKGCKTLSAFWCQLSPKNSKERAKTIKEHLRLTIYFMNNSCLRFQIAHHFALCEMIDNGFSLLSFEYDNKLKIS